MTWNLHIVGEKVLDDVDAIAAAIVKAITDEGHSLVSAVLTTDFGPKDITPAAPAPPADPAPPVPTPPSPDPSVPTDTPPVA